MIIRDSKPSENSGYRKTAIQTVEYIRANGIALRLSQGTIYPALLRLEQRDWSVAAWGTSENNRKVRFYTITKAGRRRLWFQAGG